MGNLAPLVALISLSVNVPHQDKVGGRLECFMFSHSVFASNRNSFRIAFGLLRVSSCWMADPSVRLCDEVNVNGHVHIC